MTNSPTFPVTIAEIMADPKFALGVADIRAGREGPTIMRTGPATSNGITKEAELGAPWPRAT
jgi:hypothetical protein